MSMPMPMAEFLGVEWLFWWQPVLLIILIGLIIFLKKYRNSQM